jgi:hypothetical protein
MMRPHMVGQKVQNLKLSCMLLGQKEMKARFNRNNRSYNYITIFSSILLAMKMANLGDLVTLKYALSNIN